MQVDKFLLRIFQLISEKVYSWVGVNNFTMARCFFVLVLALQIINYLIFYHNNKLFWGLELELLVAQLAILVYFLLILFSDLKEAENIIKNLKSEEDFFCKPSC